MKGAKTYGSMEDLKVQECNRKLTQEDLINIDITHSFSLHVTL